MDKFIDLLRFKYIFQGGPRSIFMFFVISYQRQRLGAVFFGKLCGTAPAQKGILCGQVR